MRVDSQAMRKALEFFGGSVVVYVVVAACSAAPDELADLMPGGLGQGGDQSTEKNTKKSAGSGASDGASGGSKHVASAGETAIPGDGDGDGDGNPILNPVKDADAAEDGQRIVNLYRETAGGLKTHEGYFDKELGVNCAFQRQTDGKEYCVPAFEGYSQYTFSDESCTSPVLNVACGGAVPSLVVAVITFANDTCGTARYVPHRAGTKLNLTKHYTKYALDGPCNEAIQPAGSTYYSVGAPIPMTDLVEGTASHG